LADKDFIVASDSEHSSGRIYVDAFSAMAESSITDLPRGAENCA